MRNCYSFVIKYWKQILLIVTGITISLLIIMAYNSIKDNPVYIEITDNWITIPVIIAMMITMAISGYFAGKKYE